VPECQTTISHTRHFKSFILGLNYPALQLEVMKNEPPNIEAALSHAIKVEAYEQSLACTSTRAAGAGNYSERRPRNAYAIMDREGSGQAPDLHHKVDELSVALAQVTENIAALAVGMGWSQEPQVGPTASTKETQSAAGRAQPSSLLAGSTAPSRGRSPRGTRGNAQERPKIGPCSNCHKLGHLGKDCRRDRGPVPSGTGIKLVSCPYATSPRIHIAAHVNGKPVRCLVDSGCERTVIGRKLVPNAKLTPSRYVLTAVNKTDYLS